MRGSHLSWRLSLRSHEQTHVTVMDEGKFIIKKIRQSLSSKSYPEYTNSLRIICFLESTLALQKEWKQAETAGTKPFVKLLFAIFIHIYIFLKEDN